MTDTPVPEPGTGAPVTGELVDPPAAAVIPSQAEENSAADRARGRTAVQTGIPTALVIILVWLLRLNGIDLNPMPDVDDVPPEVATALAMVLANVLAFRMNPKKK